MMQSIIDSFLEWEITQILLIQKVFLPIEPYLEIVSHITTARFLHSYIIPLFLVFSVKQYVNIMIAATTSHISIILLKWIFAGTRPYWWINETDIYASSSRPVLRQTYLTCETTAGFPSGHVMFTASTLFFAIQTILQNPSQRSNKAIQYFAWNIYVAILMLISMSRMFFACHFFHQCLFGAAFGIVIGRTLQSRRINNMIINLIRLEAFALAATVVLLTISIYFAHYLLASDPQWSIQKAFNWCKDPYFIKPETTPHYSLVREFGLIFGLVLCSPLAQRFNTEMDIKWSLPAVLILIVCNNYIQSQTPRWNGALLFYCFTFGLNLIYVLALLLIVPLISKKAKIE